MAQLPGVLRRVVAVRPTPLDEIRRHYWSSGSISVDRDKMGGEKQRGSTARGYEYLAHTMASA